VLSFDGALSMMIVVDLLPAAHEYVIEAADEAVLTMVVGPSIPEVVAQ
jgi:hypothetical protein